MDFSVLHNKSQNHIFLNFSACGHQPVNCILEPRNIFVYLSVDIVRIENVFGKLEFVTDIKYFEIHSDLKITV